MSFNGKRYGLIRHPEVKESVNGDNNRLTQSERIHPVLKGSPWWANDHSSPVLKVYVIFVLKPPAGEDDEDDDKGGDDENAENHDKANLKVQDPTYRVSQKKLFLRHPVIPAGLTG